MRTCRDDDFAANERRGLNEPYSFGQYLYDSSGISSRPIFVHGASPWARNDSPEVAVNNGADREGRSGARRLFALKPFGLFVDFVIGLH
jgi:hypothetical protein